MPEDIVTALWEDKNYIHQCPACGKNETVSTYAVAQIASGNEIIYNCTCGKKYEVVL